MGTVTTVIVARNKPDGTPPPGRYEIIQRPHGIEVRGPVPVSALEGLIAGFAAQGYDRIDYTLGSALGATMAVTNEVEGKFWRAEIDARAARLAAGDAELEWLLGTDTGTSSRVLLAVLGQSTEATRRARVKLRREYPTPQDPDDLGRCVRLLDRFPAWRDRLGEIAAQHPAWGPMVSVWSDLEATYREELPGGTFPATAALMRTLVKLGHGKSEATVDLVALFDPEDGLHPEAMAGLCAALDCSRKGLPDRIFARIPDGAMLFWARDPEEATVYGMLTRAAMDVAAEMAEGEGEDGRNGERQGEQVS